MSSLGKLYLIPIPIADDALNTLSPQIIECIPAIKHYVVENVRTTRRFLKAMLPTIIIDELQFSEIDKHHGADVKLLQQWLKQGLDVGLMSEAGCPGIADPGSEIVKVAQKLGAIVIPLVGPNSLMLALMASGLNGQCFCFHGYLPVKEPARTQKIKQIEANSKRENQTQIFIETPYRNNHLLEELIKNCFPQTQLCIAQNITAPNQYIKTKTIDEWKRNKPNLEKLPTVFLVLS